jgi:hypothetical protein
MKRRFLSSQIASVIGKAKSPGKPKTSACCPRDVELESLRPAIETIERLKGDIAANCIRLFSENRPAKLH